MIRSLWSALSFLALVHLLALLGFTGWLWQSGRLDRQRLESVRQIFTKTLAEVEEEARVAAAELARQEQAKLDEAKRLNPPVTSATQIHLVSKIEEQANQAQRRMIEDHNRLTDRLTVALADLDSRVAAFEAGKKAWEEQVKAEQQRKIDEQFAQVVKLLESIPAKQAKEKIRELINTGKTDQAVAYLDAMSPRATAAVIKEFKSAEENRLATDLLEQLRRFGTTLEPDEDAPDAHAAAGPT